MKERMPAKEKYMLTVQEASEYFNIGLKQMRRIAENHQDTFSIFQGNRYLIIRTKCEEYILSCLKTEGGGNKL